MITNNMGEQGFVWFVGLIVDILDPKKVGRVKVRILNEHFDKIEDSELLWAKVMVPATNASKGGIGISPTGIENDSYCIGFYMDGFEKNKPIIIGTFHLSERGADEKSNDVSSIARGDGPVEKDFLDYEPKSPYGARYPFNKVIEGNSGHVIEMDDTPGAERIHIFHKSGAYIEITPEGDINTKSPGINTDISMKEKYIIVDSGDLSIEAKDGETTIKSTKNINIKSDEEVLIEGKQIFIKSEKNMELVSEKGKLFVVANDKIELDAKDVEITKGKLTSPKTLDIEALVVNIVQGKLKSDKVITLTAPVVKAEGLNTIRLDIPVPAGANVLNIAADQLGLIIGL